MLAFLGFPLGGLVALTLVGSVEGAVSGALGGALAGAVIGAAQWLVLRRYLRACLVSNRVGLGGAKSAPFTRGTASREPFLRGSFFGFRSVSSKESPQRVPPRTPENAKKV